MNQYIAHISILVDDYDKAIDYYINKLHFKLIEDTKISEEKRWVLVEPDEQFGCSLLLAKAVTQQQKMAIGNQSGGRVFLFLHTDNFERDFKNLVINNILIEREPRDEYFGKVAVFRDLYGNLWDLIELKNI